MVETNILLFEIDSQTNESLFTDILQTAARAIQESDQALLVIFKLAQNLKSVSFALNLSLLIYSIQPQLFPSKVNLDLVVGFDGMSSYDNVRKISRRIRVLEHNCKTFQEFEEAPHSPLDSSVEYEISPALRSIIKNLATEDHSSIKLKSSGEYSCMGGTFDHMHFGHKLFLSFACLSTSKLLVGITADEMLTKKQFLYALEPRSKRRWNVKRFLDIFDPSIELELYNLTDGLGPYERSNRFVIHRF